MPKSLFRFLEEQRKSGRREMTRSAYIQKLLEEEEARVARRKGEK